MWFKRLVAKNVGPFGPTPDRHLDLNLERGLIGVVGANGRGKSTLVNLLYSALTNDFGWFSGLKAQLVNDLAAGEESYFRVELEHAGRGVTIERSLPEGSWLSLDGGKKVRREPDIAEALQRLLGVDRKMLDLFVFKRQDRIYDFLAVTDARRKEAFQTLCRTEACATLWDLLGEFLNKDADLRVEIVDDGDELARKAAQLKDQLRTLGEERAGHESALLDEAEIAKARRVVKRRERLESLREDLATASGGLGRYEARAGYAGRQLRNREKKAVAARRAEEGARLAAEKARSALKDRDAYDRRCREWDRLRVVADSLESERLEHPAPDVVDPEPDVEGLVAERERVSLERADAVERLSAFDRDGLTACPTCGTPVAAIAGQLEKWRAIRKKAPGRLSRLDRDIDAARSYRDARNAHRRWEAGFVERARANREALERLADPAEPEIPERAALETLVARHDACVRLVDGHATVLEKRRARHAAAEARLEMARGRVKELETRIAGITVTKKQATRAREALERHAAAANAVARLDGQMDAARAAWEAAQEDLRRLRARLKRARSVRAMAAVVGRVRDAFHRDSLPNRVARANLGRMEGRINKGLEGFGAPFWVESADDLTFTVHKPGHPPQPAGRLSVGQRVVLAVPFWLAVAALWKTELGVLCLDEPTAHLDGVNQAYLASVLGNLGVASRGSRQIVVVTHAEGLRSCFDQVIDLGS